MELEVEISKWRSFVEGGAGVKATDVEELEAHLREQIDELRANGLSVDEAFLVAVKRMGALDELSREFAREHSDRLWRQLVIPGRDESLETEQSWPVAIWFALGAAVAIQAVRFISSFPEEAATWVPRNLSLFVLPVLAGYFALQRRFTKRQWIATAALFAVSAAVINLFPYHESSSTELLVAAHLPVLLWFVVAYPYTNANLASAERRMDFVRFTGEWFIYYVLIALGGGVLTALTVSILEPAGVDVEQVILWVLPSGAAGAVIIAAWLVESKQRVIENMAPVLTMIFTPLFAVMLTVAAIVYAVTGGVFNRELLGIFDALMVVVVGLVLYSISARDPSDSPGWMDRIQLVAVSAALILDGMVLGSMVSRIGELGFTPNRTAAFGLNLVLMASLAGTAWHSFRFLTGRAGFHQLETWQTTYLHVFAVWAALVVVALPPLFAFG